MFNLMIYLYLIINNVVIKLYNTFFFVVLLHNHCTRDSETKVNNFIAFLVFNLFNWSFEFNYVRLYFCQSYIFVTVGKLLG